MARGKQLIQLVGMLREEIGRATSVAVGIDDLPGLKNKLNRTQEVLYDGYAWPFLRQIFPLKPLLADEQYYDFPAGLNLERLESVYVWYNNLPKELTRGIGIHEYAVYNSQIGVTSEPAIRWDVRWTGTATQFEIWPIPSGNDQQIQFTGIRDLRPLVKDSDVADLDDQLIVLFAAAELLAKQGSESAEVVAGAAKERRRILQGRVLAADKTRRLGMGQGNNGDQRLPIVVVARAVA